MPGSRYSCLAETLSKNWKWVVLILFGVLLHAIGVGRPFLGHFAQHQTDYATVVQRWLSLGLDPLHPFMRFIALGKNRLFFGDLPLNMIAVTLFCQWTHASIEFAGRGLSFLYFLASIFPVYRIARSIFEGRDLALIVLAFYVFSPLTLIYSQLFLLEMPALCLALWAWFSFFLGWKKTESGSRILILSAVFWALCFMTRIYFVLLLIPIVAMFVGRYRWKIFARGEAWCFFLIALLPPVFWQGFAAVMASLAGDQSSLLDNLRVFVTHDKSVSRAALTAGQYLPILKSLVIKIATPIGFLFSVLAVFFHESRRRPWIFFLTGTFISFFLLFVIAPRKFIEFEYYFLPLVPVFCFMAVFFLEYLVVRWNIKPWMYGAMFLALVITALRFSLPSVLVVPAEDRNVLLMGKEVRDVSTPSSRVIAAHGASSSFLYYTDRDGWAFPLQEGVLAVRNQADAVGTAIDRLERFRSQGALYFALVNFERVSLNRALFEYLGQNYPLIFRSGCGLIYSLKEKK
jgi:hypothetical protein